MTQTNQYSSFYDSRRAETYGLPSERRNKGHVVSQELEEFIRAWQLEDKIPWLYPGFAT
jgi:hypothetical protein